jgi:protein involved in polysaccharide export with SLBB domain
MKKITVVLFLLINLVQAQNLDIGKLSNSDLDKFKERLKEEKFESDNPSNNIESSSDVKSLSVEIDQNENLKKIDNKYFGYNYFKTEINFFDNIPTPSDFKLGAGDEIILSLWGEINLREKFIINKEGLIYYKNIGFINISNKTIDEAEELLSNELSKIFSTINDSENSTKLMLELGKLKSLNIYFSGEINKPGIRLVHPSSDIFAALVQVGGVNVEGSLRNIQLIRNNEKIDTIDLYSFFTKGSNDFSNLRLVDGDIIHVPPVQDRIEIKGSVIRPGFYELLSNDSLKDIIGYAAGLEARASSVVTIDTITPIDKRTSQDNIISSMNIDLKNSAKISLNNGDTITVRDVGDSSTKVQIYGRVKVPGEYSSVNMTLRDILDIAGGFDDPIFRQTINTDEIRILRKDKSQFYGAEFVVKYKDAASFSLNVDDKIFVYEDINYKNNFTYRVEGQVNKPGTYPLIKGITIGEALKLAGGFTEFSSYNNLIVSQEFTELNELGEEVTVLKNVANPSLDFELGENSVINALPYENVVKVEGNVYSPGLVAYSKGLTISQAIDQAGGFMTNSLKRKSYVIKANGQKEKAHSFFTRVQRLDPGDTIIVPLNPNPSEFDLTTFIADLSTTLANIAAILLIVDNQTN